MHGKCCVNRTTTHTHRCQVNCMLKPRPATEMDNHVDISTQSLCYNILIQFLPSHLQGDAVLLMQLPTCYGGNVIERKLMEAITGFFLRPWWPAGKWFTENQVDAVQTLCQRGTFQGRAVVNLFQSVSISFPAYLGHCWNKFTHNFQTWNWSFLVRLLAQGSLQIVWGCCLQACLAVFDLAPDPYTL